MPQARFPLALLAAALSAPAALILVPAALHAEEREASAHETLVAVLASDAMRDGQFEREMQVGFRAVFEADADMVAFEAECPGLFDALENGLAPVIRRSHNADYALFRRELRALFESGLSEGEAAGAARFFAGADGQRLLGVVLTEYSADAIRGDVLSNDDMSVSREAYERDEAETKRRVTRAMGEQELARIGAELMMTDWFPAFAALKPRMDALNLALANKDFSPEEDAEIESVSAQIAETHWARCDAAAAATAEDPAARHE